MRELRYGVKRSLASRKFHVCACMFTFFVLLLDAVTMYLV